MERHLVQHVASALNPVELASDPEHVGVLLLRRAWRRRSSHWAKLRAHETVKRVGEINIGASFLLDALDDAALAGRDDVVQLVVDLERLGMEAVL